VPNVPRDGTGAVRRAQGRDGHGHRGLVPREGATAAPCAGPSVREGAPLPGNRQAFVEAGERADVRYHVLRHRAIEHYMPDAAVKSVKGPKYRALTPFEDRRTVTPMWSREENWRIARALSRE